MNYANWPEKKFSVINLHLDPKNPRIPPQTEKVSQRELIEELIEHEKIWDLTKNIAINGFYPIENIIITKENGKYIVVEGNRRVTALKLLVNPGIAPESEIAKYRSLANKLDANQFKSIRALVAPSRDAAARLVMDKHTRPQVSQWKPIMKAKFYQSLQVDGKSIDDIAEEYRILQSEIISSNKLLDMYRLSCALELPKEIQEKVTDSRNFDISTLERLYEKKVVQTFLGIEFDNNGKVVGKINENEFKKGLKKLVTDVVTKIADSRFLNKISDIEKYISGIKQDERPDLSKKGIFNADTIINNNAEPLKEEINIEPKKNKKVKKSKKTGLIPQHVKCEIDNQRINGIFNELTTIPIGRYSNSAAYLLRGLLEMSLSYYLEKTGHIKKIKDAELEKLLKKHKENQFNKNKYPELSEMLNYISDSQNDVISNPKIIKALSKSIRDNEPLFSLNLFVHNEHYHPTEEKIRAIWQDFESLFEIILIEPEVN